LTRVARLLAFAALGLAGVYGLAWLIVQVERRFPAQPADFARQAPALGDPAPEFTLLDTEGKPFDLHENLGPGLLVLEFGSITCLKCVLGDFPAREAMAREFAGQAEFVFVYCKEAHPDKAFGSMAFSTDEFALPQTHTPAERTERALMFRTKKSVARRTLVDLSGDNSVQKLYGNWDNQLIVIDQDGRIVLKQRDTDVRKLRAFLQEQATRAAPVVESRNVTTRPASFFISASTSRRSDSCTVTRRS
jgi:peroxiredoxin